LLFSSQQFNNDRIDYRIRRLDTNEGLYTGIKGSESKFNDTKYKMFTAIHSENQISAFRINTM